MRLPALLLYLIMSVSPVHASTSVLVFGDDAYPPYSYLNDEGVPSGIYVDLLQHVFAKMDDYEVAIELVPWERALTALSAGEVFAVFPPYFYPDNVRPYIGAYSVPLYEESVAVFCRNDVLNVRRSRWPEDFYGLSIGMNQGFAFGGDAFWLAVEQGDVLLSEAQSNWHNLLMLMDDRIDCYVNDRLSILRQLQKMHDGGDWRGELPEEVLIIERHTGHLAYSLADVARYPFYDHFMAVFDQLFLQVEESGVLDELTAPYVHEVVQYD